MSDMPPQAKEAKSTLVSRRAVVQTAAPMILTLSSGKAMAMSSNTVTTVDALEAKDLAGNTLCLDAYYQFEMNGLGEVTYDLGPDPTGDLYVITERDYHTAANSSPNTAITEGDMCRDGGVFYYKGSDGKFQQASLPKGLLVSITAMNSFTSIARIDV